MKIVVHCTNFTIVATLIATAVLVVLWQLQHVLSLTYDAPRIPVNKGCDCERQQDAYKLHHHRLRSMSQLVCRKYSAKMSRPSRG